jgi:hypothetical protein
MDKKYYVIGPRNAWDTVEIGLFESYRSALDALPCSANENIIREATSKEIEVYLTQKYIKISNIFEH